MSEDDEDLKGKSFGENNNSEEESYSNEKPIKESISAENSKKKLEEKKSKEINKFIKEEDLKEDFSNLNKKKEESSDDEDSSEDNRKKKEKKNESKIEEKSESSSESEDSSSKKERKEKNAENKIKDREKEDKKEEDKKKEEEKKKEEKEKEEKKRKEIEKRKKEEEYEKKRKEEERERERKKEEERRNNKDRENREKNDYKKNQYNNNNGRFENNNSNFNNRDFNNYRNDERNEGYYNNNRRYNYNQNRREDEGNYQQKNKSKFDLNEIKALNKIVSDNIEIVNEMKSAYPGLTQLECASVLKKITNSKSQTIFEMMNQIHREICTQITLNEVDKRKNNSYLLPLDPYEVIDPFYNNPEHIKIMKYYKIYSKEDKDKLPPFISKILVENPEFCYSNEGNRRRKLIKYPDGGFNYIPIKCQNNCKNDNCPYSHNDLEMEFHPLFYKTTYSSGSSKGIFDKVANNLMDDFRIIYNYKNENIIKLLKLLDEKKLAKSSFKEIFKNKINSFKLETFKTIECPSIKSGITCPKDTHLCYFYHTPAERRRPPSLYRYTNEMCPEQKFSESGRIIKKCQCGDFCNLCHSRYEYYYHKLFYGKAMTCLRPKKNGKCIFEETCYAYHPYKEPGYKKTREEIIQEKKDELMDIYTEEYELLRGLIKNYKCKNCEKCNKKFQFYYLVNCEHIICNKCFKGIKKCPICKEEFDNKKEGEDFVVVNFKESSKNIDDLIKKNYEEKKLSKDEKEKEEKKDKEEDKEEKKVNEGKKSTNEEKELKDSKKKEKSDKSDSEEEKDNNNSMG